MTSLRLSNSKCSTYRRCPKKYDFRYNMKLRPKRVALPLKKGDWIHQLLMLHYDGQDWRVRHRELSAEFSKLFNEEKEEYGDLPRECARIMRNYLVHYHLEDRHYKVLDTEVDELVELPNGDQFNFIIDLIVEEDDGGVWLWDHKNVATFMDADFMLIDAQLAKYAWAAPKVGYPNIRGVVFNELCTKSPTVPTQLATGGLTQRANLQCDVYTYMREIKRLGLDPKDYAKTLARLREQSDRWFRRTRMPADRPMVTQVMREMLMTSREIKAATRRNEFPRTPDKSCRWSCEFMDACISDLQGADIADLIELRFERVKREADLDKVHTKILTGGSK